MLGGPRWEPTALRPLHSASLPGTTLLPKCLPAPGHHCHPQQSRPASHSPASCLPAHRVFLREAGDATKWQHHEGTGYLGHMWAKYSHFCCHLMCSGKALSLPCPRLVLLPPPFLFQLPGKSGSEQLSPLLVYIHVISAI